VRYTPAGAKAQYSSRPRRGPWKGRSSTVVVTWWACLAPAAGDWHGRWQPQHGRGRPRLHWVAL